MRRHGRRSADRAATIRTISAERIAAEMRRILGHAGRAAALPLLRDTGLLAEILPELHAVADSPTEWERLISAAAALRSAEFTAGLATLLDGDPVTIGDSGSPLGQNNLRPLETDSGGAEDPPLVGGEPSEGATRADHTLARTTTRPDPSPTPSNCWTSSPPWLRPSIRIPTFCFAAIDSSGPPRCSIPRNCCRATS